MTHADKVVLITGVTDDGLGKKLAREPAARGSGVLLHGRNPEKTGRVIEEITEATTFRISIVRRGSAATACAY